ncbi:MAG: S-methyl-5'-thioadenosine phosphorylase, partial [Candidatus Dormibacteraceae bacterium]
LSVRGTGTYACLGGPRRETAAEVRMLRIVQAHVVGMTAAPETILARELGLHYAAVGSIIQWAAGIKGAIKPNSKTVSGGPSRLLSSILDALRAPELASCSCRPTL